MPFLGVVDSRGIQMSEQSENKKCPCEGGTLTRFIQPVILSILSREDMTGYQVIQRMPEYAPFEEGGPDQAGAYRYIRLMTQRGYLMRVPSGEDEEQELLSITPAGLTCLERWRNTLRSYHSEIGKLMKQI